MSDVSSLDHLQDRLSAGMEVAVPDAEMTIRAMFGGRMAYIDGRPFASLSDIGLALKLAPAAQADLLKEDGAKRLRYEPDAPESKQYVVVTDAILEDAERLAPWVTLSVGFVKALPTAKKRTVKGEA